MCTSPVVTWLTRTFGAHSSASALLSVSSPAFAAEYAEDLVAALRLLVLDGRLPAGTRLPAERVLAGGVGVSRTTVGDAVERLRAAGMLASRRGSGSWITLPSPGHPAERPSASGLLDLARAAPEAVPGLIAAMDEAQLRMPEHVLANGYHNRGVPELREALAQRYTERCLPTSPEQIVITNGGHAALVLALGALSHPGDRVLVEQPGLPNALDAVRGASAIPVPVAMTGDGWPVEGIEAAIRQSGPSLAYLVPDIQNPTGLRMDTATRERLGELLTRTFTIAVADEALVELDYPRPRVPEPPLARFAGEQVITVGSASKAYGGGRSRIGIATATAGRARPCGRSRIIRAIRDMHSSVGVPGARCCLTPMTLRRGMWCVSDARRPRAWCSRGNLPIRPSCLWRISLARNWRGV